MVVTLLLWMLLSRPCCGNGSHLREQREQHYDDDDEKEQQQHHHDHHRRPSFLRHLQSKNSKEDGEEDDDDHDQQQHHHHQPHQHHQHRYDPVDDTHHNDHHHDHSDHKLIHRGCGMDEPPQKTIDADKTAMRKWKARREKKKLHPMAFDKNNRKGIPSSKVGNPDTAATFSSTLSGTTLESTLALDKSHVHNDHVTTANSVNNTSRVGDVRSTPFWMNRGNHTDNHNNSTTSDDDDDTINSNSTNNNSTDTIMGPSCHQCVHVPVIFHVLDSASSSQDPLALNSTSLYAQLDILQDAFRNTPFRFVYDNNAHNNNSTTLHNNTNTTTTTTTIRHYYNNSFATILTRGNTTMETQLGQLYRTHGPDTLHVYWSLGNCQQGLLGYTHLPSTTHGIFPDNTYNPRDAIYMCWQARHQSGTYRNYNEGKTLVHEVGHWLGLYHTFRGQSCTGPGDWVDDTPMQRIPTAGCPSTPQNSCPQQPGHDASDNYMDYSYDVCMETFTEGQKERMYAQFDLYRRDLEGCQQDDESDVVFQIQFDDKPFENDIRYIDWSTYENTDLLRIQGNNNNEGQTGGPLLSSMDHFANQTLTRRVCLPKHTLYEFRVGDSAHNGIQPPGYYSLTVNDRELVRADRFVDTHQADQRYFFYTDQATCRPDQLQWRMDLQFATQTAVEQAQRQHYNDTTNTSSSATIPSGASTDSNDSDGKSSNDNDDDNELPPIMVSWQILNVTADTVLNQHDTFITGFDHYTMDFFGSTLFVEVCLDQGVYAFSIVSEHNTVDTFRLLLNEREIKRGGGDGYDAMVFIANTTQSSSSTTTTTKPEEDDLESSYPTASPSFLPTAFVN